MRKYASWTRAVASSVWPGDSDASRAAARRRSSAYTSANRGSSDGIEVRLPYVRQRDRVAAYVGHPNRPVGRPHEQENDRERQRGDERAPDQPQRRGESVAVEQNRRHPRNGEQETPENGRPDEPPAVASVP